MNKRILSIVYLLAALATAASTSSGEFVPSPKLQQSAMPEPPIQRTPWVPVASTLPGDLEWAVAKVFEQGMADPRGCEYRQVSVGTGSCWAGDAGVRACKGWVLPADNPDDPRFVICWNGLVYPAVSVGEPADLEKDIAALLQMAEKPADTTPRKRSTNFLLPIGQLPEGVLISHEIPGPLKLAMLIRLGKNDLAERYWKLQQPAQQDGRPADQERDLTAQLIWARFDRAIGAHMRADHQLALIDLQALVALRKLVNAEPTTKKGEGESQYQYLQVTDRLMADQLRRVKEPLRKPAVEQGEKAFASKANWIAALVQDLDQVNARQMGQPGGVSLGSDAIVQALIACGDDAVEPLIVCLEKDTRLTRSVRFWREFSPHRTPLGTHEAAYVALSGILQTSFFGIASTGDSLTARGDEGRQQVANEVRAYWQKYKGVPLTERWYRILADDQATPAEWMQAMGNIVRPVDVTVSPSSMFGAGWISIPDRKRGEVSKLHGESLRGKVGPSVIELAAKRMDSFNTLEFNSSNHFAHVGNACGLAVAAYQFNREQSLPLLRKQLDIAVKTLNGDRMRTLGSLLHTHVATLTRLLARSGDGSALKVYAEWIRTQSPETLESSAEQILSNLWLFPDEPVIAEAAEWMFNGERSAWNPIIDTATNVHRVEELLHSPLLGLPAFRKQMLRGLKDTQPYGTLVMGEDRRIELKLPSHVQRFKVPEHVTQVVPAGTSMVIRHCDRYAKLISKTEGAPAIEFYWPDADRDAAVNACVEYLRRYGPNLANDPAIHPDTRDRFADTPLMTFPSLDHTASKAEVDAHRAIFSLEGQADRRLFTLPAWPTNGIWTTLKKYPWEQSYYDTVTDQSGVRIAYHQSVRIWQAEEVFVDGKWERYFGVVGPHEVARVHASEIDLPGDGRWRRMQGGFELMFSGLNVPLSNEPGMAALTLQSPLPVQISVRNGRGIAHAVPSSFAIRQADGALAIPAGFNLVLERIEGLPHREIPHPVQAKPIGTVPREANVETKVIESAHTIHLGQIDLRELFTLTEPGTYRVRIQTTAECAWGETRFDPLMFVLQPDAPTK